MQQLIDKNKPNILWSKANYYFLLAGLFLIIIGFVLMSGGRTQSPEFTIEIYSFQHITLAPVLIVSGFVLQIFAIMHTKN